MPTGTYARASTLGPWARSSLAPSVNVLSARCRSLAGTDEVLVLARTEERVDEWAPALSLLTAVADPFG